MTSLTLRIAAVMCATCLPACATHDGPYYGDEVVDPAPVGTNIKSKNGYRRGGSSSSIKVIGRNQLRGQSLNSSEQSPNRTDPKRRK